MDNSTNETNLRLENLNPELSKELQIYHALCITIAVAAFLANFPLCVIHACCKKVQKTCNIFLVSHYISNTIQSLTAVIYFGWPNIGDILLCILNISFSSSVLCVPVISLITLCKTIWAAHYTAFSSGNLPFLLLAILLLVALGVAVPPFLGWGSPILHEHPSSVSLSMSYCVFIGVVLTVVPLVILCFSNYKLFKRVRGYEQQVRRESLPQVKANFDSRKRDGEAKWIMLLQIAAFVTCLVSITVENILASVIPRIIPDAVKYSFNCLAQAYCLFSPLLHGFTNREIRRAFKCCCRQKSFELHGRRMERAARKKQISEGRCRETNHRAFIVPREEKACDEIVRYQEPYCADRGRLVRFTGVSVLSVDFSVPDDVDEPRARKPATRGKRPITTEFAPIRRHSTIRKHDDAPRRQAKDDDAQVRFDVQYIDKQRKKYIATPSIKRMRHIKRCMSDISLDDFQTSLASITGSEFESQQHQAPHFTNYSDPMRSAGFRQVLTGKGRRPRTSSLHRDKKFKPNTKAFMQRRCSFEADYFLRTRRKQF